MGPGAHSPGLKIGPKVCGILLMLNQNIVNCTTPKGKHQDIFIEHQWNTITFWVYNQYSSNVAFNGAECAPGPVKILSI